VQGHAGEGEGERDIGCAVDGLDGERVKRGVEERGVEAESASIQGGMVWQAHLSKEHVAELPDSAQALEVLAVGQPSVSEAVIEALEVERDGALRRPDAKVEGSVLCARAEGGRGVAGPGGVGWSIFRARVEDERAAPRMVRGAGGKLKMDGSAGW